MKVLKGVWEKESEKTNTNKELHMVIGSKWNDKTFQIFHSMDVEPTDI